MDRRFQKYLTQHNVDYSLLSDIDHCPHLIVVIPCYDEPFLTATLDSLRAALCDGVHVEVIVVVNSGENTTDAVVLQNDMTYLECLDYSSRWKSEFQLSPVLFKNIRRKHAGAGYARKLGMDLAVSRFTAFGCNTGVIVSLDADTLVSLNYFSDIFDAFNSDEKLNGAVIGFEHNLHSDDEKINEAIMHYELHMRYMNLAQKYIGFPYAHHTIGSAFAVTATAYVKHGGMNRRQGGEDFYFLHKIFPHGGILELNQVKVYPSTRPSNRVPFGTGPQVRAFLETGTLVTYSFESFLDLKQLFDHVFLLYTMNDLCFLSPILKTFLEDCEVQNHLDEIRSNVKTPDAFVKRFYQFFDAFMIIKYLNYSHCKLYAKVNVVEAANDYLKANAISCNNDVSLLITLFRSLES